MRENLIRIWHTPPDTLFRVFYTEKWYDPNRAYWGVCGGVDCEHKDSKEYGQRSQCFFRVPPNDSTTTLERRSP